VAGVFRDPAGKPYNAAVTATGRVLILAIGLRLLRIREVRVANFLPALALAPVGVAIAQSLR
jgi:uncharacterized protein